MEQTDFKVDTYRLTLQIGSNVRNIFLRIELELLLPAKIAHSLFFLQKSAKEISSNCGSDMRHIHTGSHGHDSIYRRAVIPTA